MSIATITSKHQITIPKDVRARMNLHEGDQVEFEPDPSGKVVLHKRKSVQKSDGAAVKYLKGRKRLSIKEMKAAARAEALKSFATRSS
jgi:antitoxin PrlF